MVMELQACENAVDDAKSKYIEICTRDLVFSVFTRNTMVLYFVFSMSIDGVDVVEEKRGLLRVRVSDSSFFLPSDFDRFYF